MPYVVGVTALATSGLGSKDRLYLLVLPIGALILIGVSPAILMSGLSTLTLVVFTLLVMIGDHFTPQPLEAMGRVAAGFALPTVVRAAFLPMKR